MRRDSDVIMPPTVTHSPSRFFFSSASFRCSSSSE